MGSCGRTFLLIFPMYGRCDDLSLTAFSRGRNGSGRQGGGSIPAKWSIFMPAVMSADQLNKAEPNRLGPCPADERVGQRYDVPDAYAPGTKRGKEGESVGDDGIHRQKCGGGSRVIRKKIGNS